MCGIIGYTGSENALPRLLSGLSALEYRGYDSAGIAFFKNGAAECIKSRGRIEILKQKVDPDDISHCGIGHTRWATHGEPSDINSHPHEADNLYIVHNGIIENYAELKRELMSEGYDFVSETDTEVAAKVIDRAYKRLCDPVKALFAAAEEFRGSFAIAVIFKETEGKIFGIRRDNPLLAAISDDGAFITSDISAVLSYTNRFVRPLENEVVIATADGITVLDRNGKEIKRDFETALWQREEAEKGGFPFFMLKEIHEEPEAIYKTLAPRIKDGMPYFESRLLTEECIKNYSHIHIVACGTAYHAGLVAKFAIEKLARVRVSVELASEFRYNEPILSEKDLVIVISQSGETADTLAALRLAKKTGVPVLGIVNARGSTIAREADSVIHTLCGPEIAVASTKAYSVQCALLYLLSFHISNSLGRLGDEETARLTEELLHSVPKAVASVIDASDKVSKIAEDYKDEKSIFFIGRGADHALSNEAALKCKEISYIHCEAYAAGELKHGTISLVSEGVPVCAVMTQSGVAEKMISNIREVKARGADVLLVAKRGIPYPDDIANRVITLPAVSELLMPLISATAVQLLAYYLAYHLGFDVDKPRNLAKSVTVE